MSLALKNKINISKEHASSLCDSAATSEKTAAVRQRVPRANLGTVLICKAKEGSWLLSALLALQLLHRGKRPLLWVSSWGAEACLSPLCCQRFLKAE